MILKWRENLSLGVLDVDNQHKEMFNRIHRLYQACAEGKCKEEVVHLLEFLQEYIIQHFEDEEQLQIESKYPDYESHKKEHEFLTREVTKFAQQMSIEDNPSNLILDLNQLVVEWIMNHIYITDKKLAFYLKSADK